MSNKTEDQTPVTPEEATEPKTIDFDLYENTKRDMLKYKSEMKDLKAQLTTIQEQQSIKETQELEAKAEWEQVAKKYQAELETLKNEKLEMTQKWTNSHKIAAVSSAIRGFVKSEYASWVVNPENIAMENGSIDKDSLAAEVDRIRREHPQLIKSAQAPNPDAPNPNRNKAPDLDSLSYEELASLAKKTN